MTDIYWGEVLAEFNGDLNTMAKEIYKLRRSNDFSHIAVIHEKDALIAKLRKRLQALDADPFCDLATETFELK